MSQLSVAKQNNIEGKIEEFIYSLANLSAKKNAFLLPNIDEVQKRQHI